MDEKQDRHRIKEQWPGFQSVCCVAAVNLSVFEHQEHQGRREYGEKRVDQVSFSSGCHMQRKNHLEHY